MAAGELIGNAGGAQRFFKHARLMVAAIENGKIGIIHFVAADELLAADVAGDHFGFVLLVLAGHHFHRLAQAVLRP